MEENYLDGLVMPLRLDIYLTNLEPRIYNVLQGDNLYSIASGDLDLMKHIAYANNLGDPNFIKTGLKLIIPQPSQFDGDLGYNDYVTNIYNTAINSFRLRRYNDLNVLPTLGYDGSNKKQAKAVVDYGTYDGMKLDKNGFVLGMYKPEQWDLLTDRRKVLILSLYGNPDKIQSSVDMDDRDTGFTSYMIGDDSELEKIVSSARNLVNNSIKTDNSFDIPTYGIGDYMKKMSNESRDAEYKRLYGDEYLNQLDFVDNQAYDFIHSATDEDLRHYLDGVANKDVLRAINIEMNKRDYNPNGLDNKQKLYKDMFGFGDDVAFTYGDDGSVIAIDGDNHVVNLNGNPKTAYKDIAKDVMKNGGVDDEIINNTMDIIDSTNDHNMYDNVVGFNMELNDLLESEGYSKQDRNNMIKIGDIIQKIHNMSYKDYYDADSDMHFLQHFGSTGRLLLEYIVESLPKQVVLSEFLSKMPFVVDPSTERYSLDALKLSNKYLGDDYTKNIFDNRLNSTLNTIGTSMFDVGMIMYDLMSLESAVNMVLNTINNTGSKLLQNKTLNLMNEAFKSARLWKNSGFLRQAAFGTIDSAVLYNVVRDALEFSNREFNNSEITEDELDKMSAIISMSIGSIHNIKSVHDARNVFLNLKTKKGFDKVELFFFGSKRNFNELLSDKITNYIGALNMTEMIMLEAGGIAPELWSYAKNDKGFYEYLKEDKQMSDIGASIMSLLAGVGSASAGKAIVRGSGSALKGSAIKLFEISGGTDKGIEEFKYNAKNIEPSFRKTIGIKHIGLNGSVDSEDLLGWNSNGKINLDFVPKQKWNETENKSLRNIIFDKAKELFPDMSDNEINDRITKTIDDINSRIPKAQRKARLGWFLGRNSYSQIFIDNEKTLTQSNKYANGIKGLKLTDIIYRGLDVDERFGKTIESVIINSDGKHFASTKWGKFLESLPILKYHPERLYNGRSAKIVFLGNPKVLDYDYKYVLLDGREVDLFVKGEINPLIEITELKNKKSSGNSILGRVVTNDGQAKTVLNNIRGHWDVPIVHYNNNGNREELQLMIDIAGVGSGASSSGSKLSKRAKLIILNETQNQQVVTMSINKKSGSKYNLWEDAAILFRDSDIEFEIPKQFDDIIEINKEIDPIYKFILSDRNGAKNVKLSLNGEKFKFSN